MHRLQTLIGRGAFLHLTEIRLGLLVALVAGRATADLGFVPIRLSQSHMHTLRLLLGRSSNVGLRATPSSCEGLRGQGRRDSFKLLELAVEQIDRGSGRLLRLYHVP